MKTVIYHSADYDGIFCREIAMKFLGNDGINYIGWNFGDPPLIAVQGADGLGEVIVMDLPVDRLFGFEFTRLKRGENWRMFLGEETKLTWIDHHKTSIDTHPRDIPGYRIDGVAACRLAWQWFTLAEKSWKEGDGATPPNPNKGFYMLPEKRAFIDRKVDEPLAVRLAGEYDIWDHRGDGDLELQFGLRCVDEPDWTMLLNPYSTQITDMTIAQGKLAMAYAKHIDSDLVTYKSFRLKWEGLDFLCLNTGRFNSLTFAALDKPETGHDALLGFMWNGKVWTVSLYHAKHRTDLDLSTIAVKYGGGGHRGACGFTCSRLPFM